MVNRHIVIVANGFYGFAVLLGLPSLAGALFFGPAALRAYLAAPPPRSTAVSSDSGHLITAVDVATRTISAVFGFIGAMSDAVARGLAVASIAILLFSVSLYFIGRGLHAHAPWARVASLTVMIGMLLVAAFMRMLAGGNIFGSTIGMALGISGCYGLWALWRGFV
jgi:hypothetical protein